LTGTPIAVLPPAGAIWPAVRGAGAPQWIHLLPAGTIRTADKRGPYVVKSMHAIASKLAPGDKLPIDECHSTDLAVPNGGSAPARGWIIALEARADGLWGKVDWTPSGRELVADRAYRGISPVILHDKSGNVLAILRASLTNTPNLQGLVTLHSAGGEDGDDLDSGDREVIAKLGLTEEEYRRQKRGPDLEGLDEADLHVMRMFGLSKDDYLNGRVKE
jgi:hypothetical protein